MPRFRSIAAIWCVIFATSTTVGAGEWGPSPGDSRTATAAGVASRAPHADAPPRGALSWDSLSSLPAGVKLRLQLTDGSEVVGRLVSVQEDAIVLDRNKVRKGTFSAPAGSSLRDAVTFPRSTIQSVGRHKGWPTWATVVIVVVVVYAVVGVTVLSKVGKS